METRLKILRSALDEASEKGLEAVTMDAIAKRTGIRKPSLYHHFRHRDSLLKEMLEYYAPGKDFSLALDFRRSTEELLCDLLLAYVEQCARGQGKKIFRVIEGGHLYNKEAAKVYEEQEIRRLKAITAFLKKIEERKVVLIEPFAEAARLYSDYAHTLIVRALAGHPASTEEVEGFVSPFCLAFLKKGRERNS